MKHPAQLSLAGCFLSDEGVLPAAAFTLNRDIPDDVFVKTSTPQNKFQRLTRTPEPKLPALGSVIEKYRIEQLLGTGGFAAVYRATHLLLRVPVCIKMLKPKIVRADPMLAELLCEEARFAALLNHPNVVRVMDVTHSDDLTYIVMEFIDGPSLAAAIEKRVRLSPRDTVRVGMDVCQGLKAALEQGLIHRDIKPANMLLTRDGHAKIADLGLAFRKLRKSAEGAADKSALNSHAVVGTPLYMAPEQAAHPETVDFRSDIYSLGVTRYHAVVGEPPFNGSDSHQINQMHQFHSAPSPQERVPELPNEVAGVLLRMLAKRSDDRYQTDDDLHRALKRVLDHC